MTSPARLNYVTNTLAVLACCTAAGVAQAADSTYPTHSVRLIVGFAPGGGIDAMARILSAKLTDAMGQTWLVDNRGGANGNLASEMVVRANPDGR